ncbi:MAG: hypothetical protein NTX75_02770, partial [Proteobacteria bacterium]|nr:hypothetical protein [Pseudomonadota bacterium]
IVHNIPVPSAECLFGNRPPDVTLRCVHSVLFYFIVTFFSRIEILKWFFCSTGKRSARNSYKILCRYKSIIEKTLCALSTLYFCLIIM